MNDNKPVLFLIKWPDGSASLVHAMSEPELMDDLDELDDPFAAAWQVYTGPLFLDFQPQALAYGESDTEFVQRGGTLPSDPRIGAQSVLVDGQDTGAVLPDPTSPTAGVLEECGMLEYIRERLRDPGGWHTAASRNLEADYERGGFRHKKKPRRAAQSGET